MCQYKMEIKEEISVCSSGSIDMSELEESITLKKPNWLKRLIFVEGILIVLILILLFQLSYQQYQIIEVLKRQNFLLQIQQDTLFQYTEDEESSYYSTFMDEASWIGDNLKDLGQKIVNNTKDIQNSTVYTTIIDNASWFGYRLKDWGQNIVNETYNTFS